MSKNDQLWPATVAARPLEVLADGDLRSKFLEAIKGRAETFLAKVTIETAEGRAACKSLAYKVARTKTAIDDAGKEANAKRREEINAVDAIRREVRETLDRIRDEIREPLTEWEAARAKEEARIDDIASRLGKLGTVGPADDLAEIEARIDALSAIDDEIQNPDAALGDREVEILGLFANTDEVLSAAYSALKKRESEAAELEKLRKEAEARKQKEREEEARVIQEEKDRVAAEKVEAEKARLAASYAKSIEEAEERARVAEEEARRAAEIRETDRIQRERDENDRVEKAREESRLAEVRRQEEEEAARVAAEKKLAADMERRQVVKNDIVNAISGTGRVSVGIAMTLAELILAGEIPHVSVSFAIEPGSR